VPMALILGYHYWLLPFLSSEIRIWSIGDADDVFFSRESDKPWPCQ
jgi:hypothetical protein